MSEDRDIRLTPSTAEMARLCGAAATLALVKARGGVAVYIPKNPDVNSALAKDIGLDNARKLAEFYGGDTVTVPRCEISKKQRILNLQRVNSRRDLARQAGATDRYVRMVLNLACNPKQGRLFED